MVERYQLFSHAVLLFNKHSNSVFAMSVVTMVTHILSLQLTQITRAKKRLPGRGGVAISHSRVARERRRESRGSLSCSLKARFSRHTWRTY